MNRTISFVIPAYDASSTIVRCLNSIYGLPLDESVYEVIVIDDCSTDNTVDRVKEYALRHDNLVLLCQPENNRQGAARNRGMAEAQGKYIVFVDSDDETAKGVIDAVQMAEENELDMVAMRIAKMSTEGSVEERCSLPFEGGKLFSGMEMQTEFPFWATAPWPYIYRREFLNKINYPFAEGVFFEDADFVNVHLFHAKRMLYCDECGYVMHDNVNSTTHTISYKQLCDYALLGTRMLSFYETLGDKTSKYAEEILEGGSFNIMKAFHKLIRLKSSSEVRAFYDRFDERYDRRVLLKYKEPAYCWTKWTRFGLKHKGLCIFLLGFVCPIMGLLQR